MEKLAQIIIRETIVLHNYSQVSTSVPMIAIWKVHVGVRALQMLAFV